MTRASLRLNIRQSHSAIDSLGITTPLNRETFRHPAAGSGTGATHPGSPAGGDNWDQRLGFLMHDVSRLRRSVFDEFMRPAGLTRSQWWVLAHLSRRDGMIQSNLADVLELGKAALGGLVDRLEGAGFVERRADSADRRAKRVYLTPKGTRMVLKMRDRSDTMSERILEGLDSRQRQQLADMLNRVKNNLVSIKSE
jgi:MarR family transcriptional regulator, transcriptional regulator for hemolysin